MMRSVAFAVCAMCFADLAGAFAPMLPKTLSRPCRLAPLNLKYQPKAGSSGSMAVPVPADFKGYWDLQPPLYESSPRHKRFSNQDWLKNLVDLMTGKSKMLKRISTHLITNTVWAGLVYLMYIKLPAFKAICSTLNPTPHSLAAGALSLLLVFRTNSAYDRFWEGRKLWGKLVNMTRELARLGHTYLRGLDREHYLCLVAAFPPLLMQHLQGKENTVRPNKGLFSEKQRDALDGYLTDLDYKLLWESRNRPFAITKMLGAIVSKAYTDPAMMERRFGTLDLDAADPAAKLKAHLVMSQIIAERGHTEKMISDYADVYGACERIIKSAVPQSYSAHTSRMLSVWSFTLPLALVNSLQWQMIPAVATICWMLFTIEEVGHSIEDPFNLHVLDARWSGMEDQLRIEASLGVLKGDVMERIPSTDPLAYEESKGEKFTARDYNPEDFHHEWIRNAK